MFSKSSSTRSATSPGPATGAKHTTFSIIGGDVTVTGNLTAATDLHIDGNVEGDISCAALVQGAASRIMGEISARSARIGGTVEGSITVEELVVEATARITGDVSYDTISIAAGGQIDGRMSHLGTARAAELTLVKNEAS